MNIFKPKHKKTVSSKKIDQLKAAVLRTEGHHAAISSDLFTTSGKRSFSFTQIWTLAAAFGVITLVPLLLLSEHYPWAIFTAVCVGIVFILAIDVLSSLKEQRRFATPSKHLQSTSLDLTSRDTIDTTMYYEVDFWSAHFDITPEELREAVKFVGPKVENVRNYLTYKRKIAESPPAEPQ